MPHNDELRSAWVKSRSQLPGDGEKSPESWRDQLRSWRDRVRPDIYILAASIGIFLLGAMIFAGKFPLRKTAMVIVILLTVTALTAVIMQSRTTYSPHRARIIAGQTGLRRLPVADGSVAAVIPGGAEVRIIDVKGDWVQIRYQDKLTGWVEKNSVKRIMPHGIW